MNDTILIVLLVVMCILLLILGVALALALHALKNVMNVAQTQMKQHQDDTAKILTRVREVSDMIERLVTQQVNPAAAHAREVAANVQAVTASIRKTVEGVGSAVAAVENLTDPRQIVQTLSTGKGVPGGRPAAIAVSIGAGIMAALAARKMRSNDHSKNGHS